MSITIGGALVTVGVPIVRGIAGWLENALEDGKVSSFEWGLLGATIVRVGMVGGAAYVGLNAAGIDIDALATAAGAVVADFVLVRLKSKKRK